MNIIERLFEGLVVLQLAALTFFGIAIALRARTPEPVERIRITITAFLAVFFLFAVLSTPFAPRWTIAFWNESPKVSEELALTETPSPMFVHHETTADQTAPPAFEGIPEIRETRLSEAANEPKIVVTEIAAPPELRASFNWISFAKCCVVAGFSAVSSLMVVFHLIAMFRLRRIVRNTSKAPEWIERLFREITAGRRNTIGVRISPHVDSPLMFGLFRTVILLPASMRFEENRTQVRYALAHELAHRQNGDLGRWYFVYFCRLLFWIQPFYRHLSNELRLEQDFLADDAASRSDAASGTGSEQYALALLELARQRIMNAAITRSSALGFIDNSTLLGRRIEMLLKEKSRLRSKSRLAWLMASCVLFFGLSVIFGSLSFTKTAAGEVQSDNKTLETPTVELQLLIVDAEDNPVPGTDVKLALGRKTMNWVTDPEGRLKVDIPLDMVDYSTELEFNNREKDLKGKASLYLSDGWKQMDPIDRKFTMRKIKRITGKVVDPDDKPVVGAEVYCNDGTSDLAVSDEQGNFELDLYGEILTSSFIFAFKPGLGSGKNVFGHRDSGESYEEYNRLKVEWLQGRHKIKLYKKPRIGFHVVDFEDNPLEGIEVRPTSFPINGFLTSFHETDRFTQKTDRDGNVSFDWIPSTPSHIIRFEISGTDPRIDTESKAGQYGSAGALWRENEQDGNEFVIRLPKKVRIDGRIRLKDGSVPRTEMWVNVIGKKHYDAILPESPFHHTFPGENRYNDIIRTNIKGEFTFFANADELISVCPLDSPNNVPDSRVAPMQVRVNVGDGKRPAPRFDFVLQKGTRLFGKLSRPSGKLSVYEVSGPDDPIDDHNLRTTIINSFVCTAFSEPDINRDEYEIYLPPGLYRFDYGGEEISELLEITDEEEIRKDFS